MRFFHTNERRVLEDETSCAGLNPLPTVVVPLVLFAFRILRGLNKTT